MSGMSGSAVGGPPAGGRAAERLGTTGRVRVRLLRPGGGLVLERRAPNLLVRSGERLLAKLLLGRSRQALTAVALGSGTAPPAPADVAVQLEVARRQVAEADKTIVESGGTVPLLVTVETVFGPGEPAGDVTVAELGLLNAAGELYARAVLDEPVAKGSALSLAVRWELHVGGTSDGG